MKARHPIGIQFLEKGCQEKKYGRPLSAGLLLYICDAAAAEWRQGQIPPQCPSWLWANMRHFSSKIEQLEPGLFYLPSSELNLLKKIISRASEIRGELYGPSGRRILICKTDKEFFELAQKALTMPDENHEDQVSRGLFTDQFIRRIYDECWELVKNDDEYQRFFKKVQRSGMDAKYAEKPRLLIHNGAMLCSEERAIACYIPSLHVVCVLPLMWEMYKNAVLGERAINDIKDIFIHELAHIIHHNHGKNFWRTTARHDSCGADLRNFRRQQLAALMESMQR